MVQFLSIFFYFFNFWGVFQKFPFFCITLYDGIHVSMFVYVNHYYSYVTIFYSNN